MPSLIKAFPKADWLIGNHDALTERQAVTAGLPPELLKDYADMWNVGWSIIVADFSEVGGSTLPPSETFE